MAAWLKPFLWALLAALALHLIGLSSVGSQMQSKSSLAKQSDPLFTRTIEAASPQTDAPPPPPPAPAPPVSTAITSVPPVATESLALAQQEPQPKPEAPPPAAPQPETPTASVSTTSPVTETQVAATPSQTLSAQPAGQTDTLLITGQWPADTRVTYNLSGYFNGDLYGSGQVQWTREGALSERYQVRVTVDAGLYELRMTSQGRVSPDGLLPEIFEEYSKRVLGNPRIRPLKLEPTELILEGNRRVPRPAQEPMAVQDSVSQFIDLGHRFQQGRAKLETGQAISIWLGRPGGLDQWVYDVGTPESMTLPRIGAVQVFPLRPRPIPNPRGTITLTMWLAPSLQYLPAKIRIDVNAQSHVELIAERLEQR